MPHTLIVAGGGFAGLWSALGAARLRHELGMGPDALRIVLVDRNDYHGIRVRNYEPRLEDCIVGFDEVLPAVRVERIEAEVERIDPAARQVLLKRHGGTETLRYDRLVFALGSHLLRPPIPGLDRYGFDVDTHANAKRLRAHLERTLPDGTLQAQRGVLVVGAGLTGTEVATELASEFRGQGIDARVTLCDASPRIGSDMGDEAAAVIEQALQSLDVKTRTGVRIAALDAQGVALADGERIDAGTVVWCAGMRASPRTVDFGIGLDRFGRLPVDEFLRVEDMPDVFVAGDSARAPLSAGHDSVMSCQHGRPMGRYAGHNAAAELLGKPMLPLHIDWYVTVVDLGAWGAVYTQGWDRHVVSVRDAAKKTKRTINRVRIYPPRNGSASDILEAAAPVVQTAPQQHGADGRAGASAH